MTRIREPLSNATPWIRASCIAALLAVVALGAMAQGQGGLVPTGPPPDANIVFTGDVIGYLDPCG